MCRQVVHDQREPQWRAVRAQLERVGDPNLPTFGRGGQLRATPTQPCTNHLLSEQVFRTISARSGRATANFGLHVAQENCPGTGAVACERTRRTAARRRMALRRQLIRWSTTEFRLSNAGEEWRAPGFEPATVRTDIWTGFGTRASQRVQSSPSHTGGTAANRQRGCDGRGAQANGRTNQQQHRSVPPWHPPPSHQPNRMPPRAPLCPRIFRAPKPDIPSRSPLYEDGYSSYPKNPVKPIPPHHRAAVAKWI